MRRYNEATAPTEREIAERAAAIRATWSPYIERRRRQGWRRAWRLFTWLETGVPELDDQREPRVA